MENTIPTDSVLRRHYEAQHKNMNQDKQCSESCGGFMYWLKKIFSK